GGVRIIARQACGFRELGERRLQLEVQAEALQARITPAPTRVVHHPGPWLVAHAAHEGISRVRFEHLGAVVAVEPGLGDGHSGESAVFSYSGNEIHLAEWIARIPFGLDVDGVRDPPAG